MAGPIPTLPTGGLPGFTGSSAAASSGDAGGGVINFASPGNKYLTPILAGIVGIGLLLLLVKK